MPSLLSKAPAPEVLLRAGSTSYVLVRPLGPARNGELMLARREHDGAFGGFCVIKRARPPMTEETRRRLVEEARVTSLFRHPNLLPTLQLEGPDDEPHLVMEHVGGHRLQVMVESSTQGGQPFTEALACFVVGEAAEALHCAHTLLDEHGRVLGVVHRDVTPHNILLSDHGEVKVLDFGAAWSRLSGRVSTESPELQGSLAYAAPEHVSQQTLDARADQFSLGIVLLQLLTGRHLFEGADRFDTSQRHPHVPMSDASRLCAHELAERIRGYSLVELQAATRAVPEALRPIVHRALAPERSERYPSCASFSAALRDHLRATGQPFGRHELLSELVSLRYVSLRMESGEAADEAFDERFLLDDSSPHSAPGSLAGQQAARLRDSPRRR